MLKNTNKKIIGILNSPEILRFLVVGILTVIIDFLAYKILISLQISPTTSKGASFFAGTIFSFFANKFFTFQTKDFSKSEPIRFGFVYISTFWINVSVHGLVFRLWSLGYPHETAWLLATGCSTVLNFLGLKFLVFKRIDGTAT